MSFGLGIILETPRLLIRPPREDDAKDVFAGVDDQVRRWDAVGAVRLHGRGCP